MTKQIKTFEIEKWKAQGLEKIQDLIAIEEPLEIAIAYGEGKNRQRSSVAVTMRTPGNDFDLALGFLFTEGIIGKAKQVIQIRYQTDQLATESQENMVLVELHPKSRVNPDDWSRHFYTSSSCGICGKASIELVRNHSSYLLVRGRPSITSAHLNLAPEQMLNQQTSFIKTGGLHAAGLFNREGELVLLREDVGRHNALDKLIGAALANEMIPLLDYYLVVSGRMSFELVQKALMAGIPFMAAVGAPSSLALELAEEYGMTLVGFLKKEQFNIYCGSHRLKK